MNKKSMVIALVLLILVLVGGGYYWQTKTQKPASVTDTGKVIPTESTQSANPYDKTNPFSNIKVNPFE